MTRQGKQPSSNHARPPTHKLQILFNPNLNTGTQDIDRVPLSLPTETLEPLLVRKLPGRTTFLPWFSFPADQIGCEPDFRCASCHNRRLSEWDHLAEPAGCAFGFLTCRKTCQETFTVSLQCLECSRSGRAESYARQQKICPRPRPSGFTRLSGPDSTHGCK